MALKMTKEERFFLLTDPKAFAALVLAEAPRPWTEEVVEDGKLIARMLPDDQAHDAFTLGLSLIQKLKLLPEGLEYPEKPLGELEQGEAEAWMDRYVQAAKGQMTARKVLPFPGGNKAG